MRTQKFLETWILTVFINWVSLYLFLWWVKSWNNHLDVQKELPNCIFVAHFPGACIYLFLCFTLRMCHWTCSRKTLYNWESETDLLVAQSLWVCMACYNYTVKTTGKLTEIFRKSSVFRSEKVKLCIKKNTEINYFLWDSMFHMKNNNGLWFFTDFL